MSPCLGYIFYFLLPSILTSTFIWQKGMYPEDCKYLTIIDLSQQYKLLFYKKKKNS